MKLKKGVAVATESSSQWSRRIIRENVNFVKCFCCAKKQNTEEKKTKLKN